MAKNKDVFIKVNVEQLRDIYYLACEIKNCSVIYNQEPLDMANQAIFQMRGNADRISNFLYNILPPSYKL